MTPDQLGRASRVLCDKLAVRHGQARRLARRSNRGLDLVAWGKKYLPDHFRRPPSNLHRWLAEQLDMAQFRRGTKLNVLGPRGAAKSTIGSLALPLRAAVECWEPYIWIVSDTKNRRTVYTDTPVEGQFCRFSERGGMPNSRICDEFAPTSS